MSRLVNQTDGRVVHPIFPFRYADRTIVNNVDCYVGVIFTRDFGVFKIGEEVEHLFFSSERGELYAKQKIQGMSVFPR